MEFNVGDRVRYVGCSHEVERGECGTVLKIEMGTIGVAWDRAKPMRHSLDGACVLYHGWWVRKMDVDFAQEEEPEDGDLAGLMGLL